MAPSPSVTSTARRASPRRAARAAGRRATTPQESPKAMPNRQTITVSQSAPASYAGRAKRPPDP
jgi:hypothetical protein